MPILPKNSTRQKNPHAPLGNHYARNKKEEPWNTAKCINADNRNTRQKWTDSVEIVWGQKGKKCTNHQEKNLISQQREKIKNQRNLAEKNAENELQKQNKETINKTLDIIWNENPNTWTEIITKLHDTAGNNQNKQEITKTIKLNECCGIYRSGIR